MGPISSIAIGVDGSEVVVKSEPAEPARTVAISPYGNDIFPTVFASYVPKIVCLATDISG